MPTEVRQDVEIKLTGISRREILHYLGCPEEKLPEGLTADIERVNFALVLDSNTDLMFMIKKASGYTGSVTVTVDGTTVTPSIDKDGRYVVTVSGIAAHKLGTAHTVKITTATIVEI